MRWRRALRRAGVVVASLLVLGVVLYLAGESYKDRDDLARLVSRRAGLASVSEAILEAGPNHTLVHVALRDARGIEVEGHLLLPAAGEPPHRVLLILGGVRTGRRTVDFLGDTGDWIVLALDYPYRGKKSGLSRREFIALLPEMRRAMVDAVPATMLAVDYLWRRGDVDRGRVVLAGGSFGALFAPAVGAADDRISAVAILFGAGDLEALIDANLDVAWPARPVEPPPNPLLALDTAMPPLPSPVRAVSSDRSTRVFAPAPAFSDCAGVARSTSRSRSSAS